MSCVGSTDSAVVVLRYGSVAEAFLSRMQWGTFRWASHAAVPIPSPTAHPGLQRAILTMAPPMKDFQVAASPFEPHNGAMFHRFHSLPN